MHEYNKRHNKIEMKKVFVCLVSRFLLTTILPIFNQNYEKISKHNNSFNSVIQFILKSCYKVAYFLSTEKRSKNKNNESIGQRTHKGPIDLLSLAECKQKC